MGAGWCPELLTQLPVWLELAPPAHLLCLYSKGLGAWESGALGALSVFL